MKDSKVKSMVMIAVMAAVMCVLGPLTVPIGPIPISLISFVIYLTPYVLGGKKGTIAVIIYLLVGLVGLPVFSGYAGGPAKLFGPTGGYLIGYILTAMIAGFFVDRYLKKPVICILGMILATAVLYTLGTVWLAVSAHMSASAAFAAGVAPFIVIDLIKMVVASLVGIVLHNALAKAGLITRTSTATA